MNKYPTSLLPLMFTAVFVSACGGGSSDTTYASPDPVQPASEYFTDWSKNAVFAKPADGAPENMDARSFYFDGNDNPNAYAELLPSGG